MKRIAIIGSGDLGQLIAHHASMDSGFEVFGFFDDFKCQGEDVGTGKVMGKTSEVFIQYSEKKFDYLMIGIGYNHPDFRKACYDKYYGKVPFATIVHSSCSIDKTAKIGEGSFLLPGCTLDKGVTIAENSLLNTGCIVAHDTNIGRHCFLGPGVTLAGFIDIGDCCFIGVGTTVIDNIKITSNTQTGGGAVVISNLLEPGLYLGIPAKKKR